MKRIWSLVLIIFSLASFANVVDFSTQNISVKGSQIEYIPGRITSIYHDSLFKQIETNTIRLKDNEDGYTLRFTLKNSSANNEVLIGTTLSYFDEIGVYASNANGNLITLDRYEDLAPLFKLSILKGQTKTIYVYVRSSKQYNLPLTISAKKFALNSNMLRNLLVGCFLGIMLAMFLYNIIIGIYTNQRDYIPYILYVLFITVAQIRFLGVEYYFIQDSLFYKDSLMFLGSSFSGIFGTLFAIQFLNIKELLPKLLVAFKLVIVIYIITALLFLLGFSTISYRFIQFGGLSSAVVFIISCILLLRKNYRPARIYLISWSFLMLGLVAYSLRDFGLIEANLWVNISFPFGVAIETVLLSLALANRINIFKQEKEESDERVIQEIRKNEELVINQNIVLEKKVKERTAELEEALRNLKAAQSQLVQSEKMASLGVLTAGIAHEINNPINFVSANVVPLKENIEILTKLLGEYKNINPSEPEKELERMLAMEKDLDIEYLLNETDLLIDGIEEGAKRTHTIVDGLKTFSRGDGSEESYADINKGIESTLSVLKSKLKGLNLVLNFGTLPLVNCQIGKLNQVFLNLINNAIDALEEKNGANSGNSTIEIITSINDKNEIEVRIKDNAIGVPDNQKEKLFEPFFTTKAIGKGTGLGLAISYGIIEEHSGTIKFESELGKGSTFKVILPQRKV